MSKDIQDQNIDDLLSTSFDLKNPVEEFAADLELVNLNYDYTNFDLANISNILMSSDSDFNIKK